MCSHPHDLRRVFSQLSRCPLRVPRTTRPVVWLVSRSHARASRVSKARKRAMLPEGLTHAYAQRRILIRRARRQMLAHPAASMLGSRTQVPPRLTRRAGSQIPLVRRSRYVVMAYATRRLRQPPTARPTASQSARQPGATTETSAPKMTALSPDASTRRSTARMATPARMTTVALHLDVPIRTTQQTAMMGTHALRTMVVQMGHAKESRKTATMETRAPRTSAHRVLARTFRSRQRSPADRRTPARPESAWSTPPSSPHSVFPSIDWRNGPTRRQDFLARSIICMARHWEWPILP